MFRNFKIFLLKTLHKKLYENFQNVECEHLWKSAWSSSKRIDTETEYGFIATSYYHCEICGKRDERETNSVLPKSKAFQALQKSFKLKSKN